MNAFVQGFKQNFAQPWVQGLFASVLTYPITADVNDGQELPEMGLYTTAINAGDMSGLEAIGFWHLTGLAIDQGAIIDSATFTVTASGGVTGTGTITLKAQKVADATVPSGSNLPSTWPLTTASVSVPLGAGDKSLDVTAIIQELVNQPTWANGNDINLVALDPAFVASNGTILTFADYPVAGYGSLSISQHPYVSHNLVNFDGANDWMTRGANIFGIDPKSMTIYIDFTTPEKLDLAQNLFAAGTAQLYAWISATGFAVSILDANYDGVTLYRDSMTIRPSTHYRLCATLQLDTTAGTGDHVAKVWLSEAGAAFGAPAGTGDWITYTSSTVLTMSGATYPNFTIGRANPTTGQWFGMVSDVTKVDGATMGFIGLWASTSRTGAYVTDPSIFFNNGKDRNLSVDLTVGGNLPAPLVAFGGTQTAADWNAGTNAGTAGSFTMHGAVA